VNIDNHSIINEARMTAGTFIQSTPLMDGDYFEKTIIYITECNENGAVGYIINRLFPRRFNELQEFSSSIAFPLYEGGPVDTEHLFFIHRRPGLIAGGTPVTDSIYVGGDFKAAVKLLNNAAITNKDIKLLIGYCGWDRGELEAEIAEGSWIVLDDAALF